MSWLSKQFKSKKKNIANLFTGGMYDVAKKVPQANLLQYQKDQAAKIVADNASADARTIAQKEADLKRKKAGMSSTNTTMDPATGQTMMSIQPFLKRKTVGRGVGYWA